MGSGGMGAGQLAPQSSASDPSEAAALPPGGGIPAGRLRTHDPQRRAEQGHPKVILAFGLVVLPGVSSLQGGGGEAKVPAAARKRAAEDRPADSTCWVAGMARSWPQALGPGPGTALPARQAQSGQAGRAQSGWLSGPFARAARASRRCSHISASALPGLGRGQGLPGCASHSPHLPISTGAMARGSRGRVQRQLCLRWRHWARAPRVADGPLVACNLHTNKRRARVERGGPLRHHPRGGWNELDRGGAEHPPHYLQSG